MKVLMLKVPVELDAKLSGLAARRGASKSEVVRQILERALSAEGAEAVGSFLEQARELCGCVEGPRDLSSNPAHLKGFGRQAIAVLAPAGV